ncbi:MAG: sulfotransferase [Congregibacter sp.]
MQANNPNNAHNTRAARAPVFVVGLSRSGTKLLRELLNRHPQVRIAPYESHFIPGLLKALGEKYPTIDESARNEYIRRLKRTGFFKRMAQAGSLIDDETLHALSLRETWPEVVEALFRHYVGAAHSDIIWGDKSPSYLFRMPQLLQHFPSASFVHIIRDPRDRAGSAQEAWGANPLISSQRWLEGMTCAARFSEAEPQHYHALRYETLVTDTERVMRDVSRFLRIPFSSETCTLARAVENRGDRTNPTRRRRAVYAGNIGRHGSRWADSGLRRIEEIVFPIAGTLGYGPETSPTVHRPLSRKEWLLYLVGHHLAGLKPFVSRWSLVEGVKQAWQRARS